MGGGRARWQRASQIGVYKLLKYYLLVHSIVYNNQQLIFQHLNELFVQVAIQIDIKTFIYLSKHLIAL